MGTVPFQAHQDAVFIGNTNLIAGDFQPRRQARPGHVEHFQHRHITSFKGHGDGNVRSEMNINANSAPVYLADGDFNHDGFDDFAVANSYSATSMSVILNNGDGT